MATQKTWIDLLGNDPLDCYVINRDICRRNAADDYTVLSRLDSHEQALRVMDHWRFECQQHADFR